MILGIDATNLRSGGGVTHISELLNNTILENYGFEKVIIWSSKSTLANIKNKNWLEKHSTKLLNKNLFFRTWWQYFHLDKECKSHNCDLLFIPGGSYIGTFRPRVTISQNLLPFDKKEISRYGFSFFSIKLFILRIIQSRTFQQSDGVIFLTNYAKNKVLSVIGNIKGNTTIIPHGLNKNFIRKPTNQIGIENYTFSKPFRIIYVSTIDFYKHQCNLVNAINNIRLKTNWPIQLELIGSYYTPALNKLDKIIRSVNSNCEWVFYRGPLPYETLHEKYFEADLGVFASSCENLPNILIETMASGLPIACSDRCSMPEVLKNAGVYFNPESIDSISDAIFKLIESKKLRTDISLNSFQIANAYNWNDCANSTFHFFKKVVENYKLIKHD